MTSDRHYSENYHSSIKVLIATLNEGKDVICRLSHKFVSASLGVNPKPRAVTLSINPKNP